MKIIILLFTLLVLTSCSQKQDNNTINVNSGESTNIDAPKGKTKEERNKIVLSELKEDDKNLLLEYEQTNKESNLDKKQELLKKINSIINTKEKEVKSLEDKGEAEKAREIKKELRAFYMFSREK